MNPMVGSPVPVGTFAWSFICYNFIWLSGIYKNSGGVGVGGVCGRCKRPAAAPEFMLQGSVYLEGGGEVIEEETHTSCRGQSLLFLQFFLPATPVCFFPSSSFSWMPSPQALLLSLVILRRLFSPHPPICAGCLFSRSLLSYPSL